MVGEGKGDEEILKMREKRVMMEEDVIVNDEMVKEGVIEMGRREEERMKVGKRKG